MKIGEQIQAVREKAKLTRKEFGASMGVTETAVTHWETNRSRPKVKTGQLLEKTYGFRLDWHEGSGPAEAKVTDMFAKEDLDLLALINQLPADMKEKVVELAKAMVPEPPRRRSKPKA